MKILPTNNIIKFIFFSLLLITCFLFVISIKIYIVLFLIYFLITFFIFNFNLYQSIFLTLLISLPFERGIRGWFIEIVPIGIQWWESGYSFYFGITVKLILIILLVLLIIIQKNNSIYKNIKYKKNEIILIGFFLMSFFSLIINNNFSVAIFGFVRIFEFTSLYFIAQLLFSNIKIRKIFLYLLLIFSFTLGLVGSWQFINNQPIGLFLEDSTSFRPYGYVTTDGSPLYRVSGLYGHPTFFGSTLSLLLPISIGYLIKLYREKKLNTYFSTFVVSSFILCSLAIFATFSRSSWIACVVIIFLFSWLHKLLIFNKNRINYKLISAIFIIISLLLIFLGPLFFTRINSFNDILNIGNGWSRLNLIKISFEAIFSSPIFGIGINNFTFFMSNLDLIPEIRNFLYPVHNTFLLFFSEIGIPAGMLFVLFVFYIFKKTWNMAKKNLIDLSIWIGALTFIINSQFQTLFSLDPSIDIFMVMLAYLSVL